MLSFSRSFKTAVLTAAVLVGCSTLAYAADAPPAYVKAVIIKISGKVVYPRMAKVRNQEGVVGLSLTIDASGGLTASSVEASSGVQSLDDAALSAAKDAAPYPAPPEAGTVVHGKITFALAGDDE